MLELIGPGGVTTKRERRKIPRHSGRSAESQAREKIRKQRFAKKLRFDGADIGPIPECSDPELREAVSKDLVLWHKTIFPNTTGLKPLGDVQIQSTEVSQRIIVHGGRALKLEPRGYGKTTRSQQEAIWSVFHGYRRFPVIFGSAKDKAEEILNDIKGEISSNPMLLALYPDICYPFLKLEGRAIKADYQHSLGKHTELKWEKDRIILPVVYRDGKPVPTSNSIIAVRSISNARGLKRRIFNGEVLRPDMVFLDDLQTYEDAVNKDRVRKILAMLRKDVFRLGGHSRSMAILKAATIIDADDVPDLLTRDKSFQTVRYKMLVKPPENERIWLGEYAEILKDYDPDDPDGQTNAKRAARDYYASRREIMDRGAEWSWDWAYEWNEEEPLEISALQHAYNILIIDGQDTFDSECQNQPVRADAHLDRVKATRPELIASVNGIDRGTIPVDRDRNYAFIDPQKEILYWAVGSVGSLGFSNHIVDYGTFPDQPTLYFEHTRPKRPLSERYPGLDWKTAVYLALEELVDSLVERVFSDQGGAEVKLDRVFIDANWGEMESKIMELCRNHKYAALLVPCKGRGVKAKDKSLTEQWKKEPGDERGLNWIKRRQDKKAVRTLFFDADFWKTQTHISITTPNPAPGSITIFNGTEHQHELFIDHILCEKETRETSSKSGRTQHEWTQPPNAQNHWHDCVVGIMAGASSEGCRYQDQPEPKRKRTKKIRFADRRAS